MNKKSKKTLKNAFNIPEPKKREEFFSSLETKQKKSFSFNIPLYISTAVTAVVIIGIWGGIKNLPYFEQPSNMDTPAYSESTSMTNHTEKTSVQTATVFLTEKNTTETSGISTVSGTENIETVSVQTTVKTENVRTETTATKESNNIPYKPTTEIRTDERTSEPETTNISTVKTTTAKTTTHPTVKTTTANQTTTSRTTVKTTSATKTTTTIPHTTTRIHYESELNYATTTTAYNSDRPGGCVQTITTDDLHNGLAPQVTTQDELVSDYPPVDLTVTPPVCYYPEGEIYTTDSESTDYIPLPPSTAGDNYSEMFREMAENSDLIAVVEVDEIIYTGFDGKPYVQENAVIKDVIYGDTPKNSRISIYCKGGYIPASEYITDKYINIEELIENNVTVLDYAGNNYFSNVGDSYVCFLKKSNGNFPDSSYYLTGLNDISKFAVSGDNCANLNNNQSLTLSQIKSFLNQ